VRKELCSETGYMRNSVGDSIEYIKGEKDFKQVKFFLRLINYSSCHEDVWGSGGIAHIFMTTELDGGEWSVSHTGRFIPGGKNSGIHCIGDWMDPRAGLNSAENRRTFCPSRDSNLDRLACNHSLYRLD
jgi:hypothetical protein